jgi:hypothetical protein
MGRALACMQFCLALAPVWSRAACERVWSPPPTGPPLICPGPANGLPSDHGCLLYFCLHQLNSDRLLPPAGPNQAPARTLRSPGRGPGGRGHGGTRATSTDQLHAPCISLVPTWGLEALLRTGGILFLKELPVIILSGACPHWPR